MDIKTSNIDQFNLLVGKIFERLYVNFPIPHPLFLDVFLDEESLEVRLNRQREALLFSFDECKAMNNDEKLVFFKATVEWLESAGLITCSPSYMAPNVFGYPSALLTNQALQCLNIVPGSLISAEHKNSQLGDILLDATKEGSKELIKDAGKAVLRSAFKLGKTYIGL